MTNTGDGYTEHILLTDLFRISELEVAGEDLGQMAST
jgi:hypothetical protein